MKHNTLKTKELENNPFINLAIDTISIKKQAIIFVNTKSSAEKTAEEIAERIKFSGKSDAEIKEGDLLASEVLKALPNPTKQCERLAKCVRKGVAFHHAGLVYRQRELIEDSFREGKIKIICSTPTLAYGVDLPAFRVIIKDLKRYTMHGMDWIPVLEYQQFCGRAGRPKYDNCGEAIAIAKTQNDVEKIRDQYIYGESESIYSKLAVEPVMRTYILSLVASGFVYTKKQLIDFFKKTFWAHQYKDMV
ncbi:MAG: helicase-related protein, partial [Candidatus Woesearchaeota archaeon]|nr:helicase-related protein [Candidatus Woesearchaeota archaeon]